MNDWRDDLLLSIVAGAFFGGMFAFGMWGWFQMTADEGIKLFFLAWAILTTIFYVALRNITPGDNDGH